MIPDFIRLALWRRLHRVAFNRPPDVRIGGADDPYMLRWHIIPRNPVFNIYFHQFLRSDDDRAHHDHPWVNLSILLRGTYTEHSIQAGGVELRTVRNAGDLKLRSPWAAHRIELTHGACWTLFITGPKVRSWGFHCARGWIHWTDFTEEDETGSSVYSRGCGEIA